MLVNKRTVFVKRTPVRHRKLTECWLQNKQSSQKTHECKILRPSSQTIKVHKLKLLGRSNLALWPDVFQSDAKSEAG